MNGRAAAIALPLLVLVVALLRARPAPTFPLAPAADGLIVALVRDQTTVRLRQALPGAALGVMPLRGAAPEQLAAGSRSAAPRERRLGETLRAAGVSTAAFGREAEALLGVSKGAGGCLAVSGVDPGQLRLRATTVLVVSLPEGEKRLGPVALWRRGDDRSDYLLTSPSTRAKPGLMAPSDVAATVAVLCGVSEARIGAGRPARLIRNPVPGYLERRSALWIAQGQAQRLLVAVPWVLAAALAAGALGGIRALQTFTAAAPLALTLAGGLVGWLPAAGVYLVAAALAGGIAWGLRRRASALPAIGWATAGVFLADTLLGGFLLGRSPFSYSVLEAARFYGVGNEAAGAWLGAAIAAASVGGPASWGILLATALGLGAPSLGADAGGGLAGLAGLGARLLTRLPPHRRLAAGWLAAGALVGTVTATVCWDRWRGVEGRSHLGEVAVRVQRRGWRALGEVAGRKASMNLHLAMSSPWSALLATALAWVIYRWRRGERFDPALLATGVTALAVNDSGVVAGATLLLLASVREETPKTRGPAPSETAAGPQAISGDG